MSPGRPPPRISHLSFDRNEADGISPYPVTFGGRRTASMQSKAACKTTCGSSVLSFRIRAGNESCPDGEARWHGLSISIATDYNDFLYEPSSNTPIANAWIGSSKI
ncbi:hypothetical protein M404DRAFT_1001836 [Pisolithus tinctorius Marx 270]|uniref:Uncharacterized protein n=1 Tax=Pisolithus tinctorius Marx 270 TaxID=870435 RepID=A0A0C3JZY5_PISTI|nr:hypothetical protein M404DRAFT_1001836 [Pisolithus tinctorius Marx 270]